MGSQSSASNGRQAGELGVMWEVIILTVVLMTSPGHGLGTIAFAEPGWGTEAVCQKRMIWLMEWGPRFRTGPLFDASKPHRGACIKVRDE